MTRFIPLILFTVLTNFLSQIMLKRGMTTIERFELTPLTVVSNVFTILFNPWVFLGLVTMVVSMGAHLVVLSRVEISFAYPFLGLSFVLITLWGHYALHEAVTPMRVIGVLLICGGVALVAQSG